MFEQHPLALRTALVVAGEPDELAERYVAARSSAADAVLFDLASPPGHQRRRSMRRLAAQHAPAVAAAGRGVHVRISDARSGELEADLAATVSESLAAVHLSGAATAQDVRDADVAIRKREMELGIDPGAVRLIPELDSAAGLLALPAMLRAVDRHSAVALDAGGLCADLGAGPAALDHACWDVAVAAQAAELPWVLHAPTLDADERSRLAARARELGAAGVCVPAEAEVRGFSDLFTPPPERVAEARRIVQEWERMRERGEWVGSLDGRLVDGRTARAARSLIALAGAIERRERAR